MNRFQVKAFAGHEVGEYCQADPVRPTDNVAGHLVDPFKQGFPICIIAARMKPVSALETGTVINERRTPRGGIGAAQEWEKDMTGQPGPFKGPPKGYRAAMPQVGGAPRPMMRYFRAWTEPALRVRFVEITQYADGNAALPVRIHDRPLQEKTCHNEERHR